MKKILFLLFLILAVIFLNSLIFAETTDVQIPSNTQITVKNIGEINSGQVKTGDFINFQVSQDLVINTQIVIKTNTPAIGEIIGIDVLTELGGKIAVLSFRIMNIKINENQSIPVVGNFTIQGKKNKAFALPGGPLFAKVKNVIIPDGTEFKVMITESTTVKSMEVPD